MIIECPACATRYDIKATLPPQGRTVRCAKCGTVWRAFPESDEAEAEAAAWAAASQGSNERSDEIPSRPHDHFAAAEGGKDRDSQSDRGAAVKEGTVADEDADFGEAAGGAYQDSGTHESFSSDETESTGKVRWFSSFRRKRKAKQDGAEEASAKTLTQPAETIPFPRSNLAVAHSPNKTMEEESTLDAAREAVRSVFSGLGQGRPGYTADVSGDDHESAAFEPAGTRVGWVKNWARRLDGFNRAQEPTADESVSEADRERRFHAEREPRFDRQQADAGLAEEEEYDASARDPDEALREAMRAHFLPAARKTQGVSSLPSENLAENLEKHLKSKAAAPREEEARPASTADLWSQPLSADQDMVEPDDDLSRDASEDVEEDTAFDQRLYRDIEETQEKSSEVQRGRGGGLALAAAWGLFLCVAGGLVAGFFAFRDTLADAAPGLAALYRDLGVPVTVQPLAFESVQYKWSVSDNRPVLTVSGSVFNRAHHNVRVPQFFITLKDQDPAQDREYSASLKVSGSKIRSNEGAGFDIELVSPNPTITAVELELRNGR